jgi:hypothetical protein
MKDTNEKIRYLGFQCTPGGGRELRFTVDLPAHTSLKFLFTISASFFTGNSRISFQEAADICRRKLRQTLDSGALEMASPEIPLSVEDVAQYRKLGGRKR